MELKIKLLTAITVLLVSFACIPSASAIYGQNFPYVENFQGKFADAYYSNNDGCIYRDIFILPVEEFLINPPFYGYRTPGLNMSIYYANACTGEVIEGDQFQPIGSSDFQVRNDLTAATLNTTATFFNYATAENIKLDVEISWTATSPSEDFRLNNMLVDDQGCRAIQRYGDTIRSAAVSGSVTYNGTNLIGGTTLSPPEIGAARAGRVVIGCF